MKKLFSFVIVLTAAIAVNATQVVFDFSNPTSLGITAPEASKGTNIESPIEVSNVTLTATNGSTATRIWNSNGNYDLRVYKNGGSLTFSCAEDMTAIEFEGSIAFTECDAATKIWQGPAKSVTFTATATCNIKKAIIYIGESPEVKDPIKATVAEALEYGKTLASGETSEDVYSIEGYVTAMVNGGDGGWAAYGNQIFWIADENNGADSNEKGAFEVYQGVPEKELYVGDKIRIITKIKNYNGVLESETKVPVELLEAGEGGKVDTVMVAEAIAEAQKLTPDSGKTASTEQVYAVKGYIAKIKDAYNSQYGNISFYMSDDATATRGDLQAYRCKISADDAAKAVEGAYVLVTGPISNYNGGTYNSYEIAQGTVEILAEAPVIELDTLNAAQALERAQALEVDAQEKVVVIAYIANIKTPYDATYGNVTVWLNDDPTSTYGVIQAYRAKASEEEGPALAEHDKVMIVGMLSHTTYESGGETKHSYQIAQGAQLTVLEKAQGIENIVLTEKAQKVMVDGVLYIVRDNKMYNVQGTQVR